VPIRDLVVTAIVVGSLPVCLLQPWIGVLVWSWIGYMSPHRLTWSFAYSAPWAMMVAIPTLAGLMFTKERARLPWTAEVRLLAALWGLFLVTTVFAFYPAEAWAHFNKVSKILLMTFVTLVLFQDERRLRALLWVIGLSIGFYGLKGGVWAVMTGAQYKVLGPPASFIAGNTEIGLALNMVLPILIFLRREEQRRWLRHVLLAMIGFSVVAILITYSRGAALGLAVVVTLLFLKSRAKLVAILLIAAGLVVASSTLPDKWFGRVETITTYQQDSSAQGRLDAWYVAYRLAKDYPLLGGGFRTFTRDIFTRYDMPRGRDAHSIFFQVLGEHGFTGLGLYVGLIGSTVLSLRWLIRRGRRLPSTQWISNCAQMLEASVAAYVVAGAFLSMSYFDLFYHLVAITVILKVLLRAEERKAAEAAKAAKAAAAVRPGRLARVSG
jgi:probable O-glycosylation ligase (exosortase A-associated)